MTQTRHLENLIYSKLFRFDHLDIQEIDNEPAVKIFSESVLEQEICLFANTVRHGDDYCRLLHEKVTKALTDHRPLPIVRFADGEYAFYRYTLGCNGLYKQAESVETIRKTMPVHFAAMEYLGRPVLSRHSVFPGNSQAPSASTFSFKNKTGFSGAAFLDFLHANHIILTADNYVPFCAVYAYLSSPDLAAAINGKKDLHF